jgi:capsular exopolysaccharide synthesis family protein
MRWIQERIEMDLPKTPVRIIDWAEKPPEDDPVRPKLALNLALSIVLGLGSGIGLAFFIEYLDTSVKTVEEIERYIGLPVLGVIPQKVRPLVDVGGDAPYAEAYRVLRANIRFSKKLAGGKVFCVTSGGVGEGKSLSVANLGYVGALLGDRALIVDADMRRPRQHKIFGVSNRLGLANVLMGECGVDDTIRPTNVPRLDMLPSGKMRTASAGLFDTERMAALLAEVKDKYDFIVFDSPPVMGVSDASILSSATDAVLLVVQHRAYPRIVSSRAKNIIDNVGGNLIGVILNNINILRDYSYYYYSSGRYGAYRYARVATEGTTEEDEGEATGESL